MRELVTAVVGGEAAVRGHTALVAHGFSGRTLGPRCVAKRNAPGQALGDQDSPFDPGGIQPPPMLPGGTQRAPWHLQLAGVQDMRSEDGRNT